MKLTDRKREQIKEYVAVFFIALSILLFGIFLYHINLYLCLAFIAFMIAWKLADDLYG